MAKDNPDQPAAAPAGNTGGGAEAKPPAAASAAIDLQALAAKVYELMKKELRLERERR
jgi:hypothetical protein